MNDFGKVIHRFIQSRSAPSVIFAAISLLILAPLLLPGYVLTLDMSWPPHWEMPRSMANGYLLYVLLAILDNVISSMMLQKIILFLIFFASGVGAYYLARYLHGKISLKPHRAALYFAGLLYTINPFTYARFMDGQWLVLLGYALLPIYLLVLLKFIDAQTWRRTLVLTIIAAVAVGISLHSAYILLILAIIPVLMHIYDLRRDMPALLSFFGLAIGIAFVVAGVHSLWLIHSPSLSQLSSFDGRHLLTFRTLSDGILPAPLNVLTLHGYWGEAQGRFLPSNQVVPLWPVLVLAILTLAVTGAVKLWNVSRRYTLIVLVPMFIAWVLSVGVSTPIFRDIYLLVSQHAPFFDGYREPQKFVMVLALGYAMLGSIGASWVLLHKRFAQYRALIAFGVVALPILYTPVLLWGGFNQLRAVDYPKDWYVLDAQLRREQAQPKTLFLPWHEYIYLNFAGRTVANPAKRFFHALIVQADDPGLGLIDSPSTDTDAAYVEREIIKNKKEITDAGSKLSVINVKYIVVSKTADWHAYDFLSRQTDLTLISDTNTLLVYKNTKLR